MKPEEFTPQQYRKFNGQSIMLALESMGGSATSDDLAAHIGEMIDQSLDAVKPEVKQVLRRGISNGFLQRRGRNYYLFSRDSTYQVDSKRKQKFDRPSSSGTNRKRIRLSKDIDGGKDQENETDLENENYSELKIEEQSIEGLQEIISKANEETRKATILASKAAKRAKLASIKIRQIVDDEDTESVE